MFSVPLCFFFSRLSRRTTIAAQVLTMAVMLVSLLSVGSGSATAQGTVVRHTATTSALAAGEACFADFADCSSVDVYIGPGKTTGTTLLCLKMSTGSALYEEGCVDVTATFAMDATHLSSANLPPTAMDLMTTVCEGKFCDWVYSRTVTVAATWASIGNRTPIQEMLGDPHGACTAVDMINGFVSESSVTLSIDGQAVSASGNLQSLDAHQTKRTNCDEEELN